MNKLNTSMQHTQQGSSSQASQQDICAQKACDTKVDPHASLYDKSLEACKSRDISLDPLTQEARTKQRNIVAMFDAIAKDYDKTNRILSLGIDVRWRMDAIKRAYAAYSALEQSKPCVILDVACGSGDMMKHWAIYARRYGIALSDIIGIDPSQEMLALAREKMIALEASLHDSSLAVNEGEGVVNEGEGAFSWRVCEGEAIDLSIIPSESVNMLSIAYGLRNVVEYPKALREFARVLAPNGVLVVLDFFTHESKSLWHSMMKIYTKYMLPGIGYLISRNYQAYKYLPDSMDAFISHDELARLLRLEGIETLEIQRYGMGISHLVLARKMR